MNLENSSLKDEEVELQSEFGIYEMTIEYDSSAQASNSNQQQQETVDEALSTQHRTSINDSDPPHRQIDLENLETDKIYLMDTSSDMQWTCYVSLHENATEKYTTTLSVSRFMIMNEKTEKKEYYPPLSSVGKIDLQDSQIQIDAEPVPCTRSVCIDEYFTESDPLFSRKHETICSFLSISPKGQFIILSTFKENLADSQGSCLVFVVNKEDISFVCELKCNGCAVFLPGEDKLCLAIINKNTLKIYRNIRTFSKDMAHDIYNLALIPDDGSFFQTDYTGFAINWVSSKSPDGVLSRFSGAESKIITRSAFIKYNIVMTFYTRGSDIIRFWSTENDCVRLASIVTDSESVIAISKDLRFIATKSDPYSDNRGTMNIYSIENSCLAYKLKTSMKKNLTHAGFCCNSRYLTLASFFWGEHGSYHVGFEVWHITEQKLVYARVTSPGQLSISPLCHKNSDNGILRPSILEKIASDDESYLTGLYSYSVDGQRIVSKCFDIIINDQFSTDIKWLEKKKPSSNFTLADSKEISAHLEEKEFGIDDDPQGSKQSVYLDQQIGRIDEPSSYEEITEPSSIDCKVRKCGFYVHKNQPFLVRCGRNTLQLWQLAKSLQSDNTQKYDLTQGSKLVYIKPYIHNDYNSCYLSPNIWRVQSFESLKFFGNTPNIRVTVNIIEDLEWFDLKREERNIRTLEFYIPSIDDENDFNYRKFEDACQALYFLNIIHLIKYTEMTMTDLNGVIEKTVGNSQKIFSDQSMNLIEGEIKKLEKNCNAFKTTSASKTLGMLASFQVGRDVLRLLLKNESISFNLLSYTVSTLHGFETINLPEEARYNINDYYARLNFEKKSAKSNVMNESVLTVLIREREYSLYHLIFNRILFNSRISDPECLNILNEALILLQELGNIEQYEKSCQKLAFLRAGGNGVLPVELPSAIVQKADLQDDLIANVGNIYSFSTTEQIRKVKNRRYYPQLNLYEMGPTHFDVRIWLKLKVLWTMLTDLFENKHKKSLNQFVICVVPFPYFTTYYNTIAQDNFIYQNKNINLTQRTPKKESLFLQLALNQHSEPNIWKQGDDVVAILLQYKWNTFIRNRFLALCSIHLLYYVCYCTGVQFAFEMYGYDPTNDDKSITNTQHIISLTLFFLSGLLLLLLEFNQLLGSQKFIHYFKSGYNIIDIAAIVLPVISFLQLRLNLNYFSEISSVCTLILWMHGIIRLRVFSSFGITLEILLQLFKKVNSVLLILLLVVFGFTHSFIVLLRQQDNQYFQENYSGETVLDGQSSMAGNTTLYDISSSNGFTDPFKAFYQVWLFIFGVWDPITAGDAGDSRMLFALCIIFAFITVLIFTNMIIALMSSTVEEVKQRGKKVWLTHFAAVIAEIESLTTMRTRLDRKNNPAFVFYAGNAEKVKIQEEKLRQETKELRIILKIDEEEIIKSDGNLGLSTEDELKNTEKALIDLRRDLKEEMKSNKKLKEELTKEILINKELREELRKEMQDNKESKEDLKKEILNNRELREELKKEMQNNTRSREEIKKEIANNSFQLENIYQLLTKKMEER